MRVPERECAEIDEIKFKTAAGVIYLHNMANIFEEDSRPTKMMFYIIVCKQVNSI